MGFSVSAAMAIFFSAFIGMSLIFGMAVIEYLENTKEGAEIKSAHLMERWRTDIQILNVSYNSTANIMWINLTNKGSTTLNTTDIDVIVNGVVCTSSITTMQVEGMSTTLWNPGETLYIELNIATANTGRVKVVTGNGVYAYATY